MKYIFVAGAPGSKWSSVTKNIYYSPDIDQSDYSEDRLYYHDASGARELMHLGAYFDPGMESHLPDALNMHSRKELEAWFDSAFAADSTGIRIVKSHIFSNHIDFLRETWPDVPIVLVHRPDDACLGWWVKCGHFGITYPDYAEYYRNLRVMAEKIQQQNRGIVQAMLRYPGRVPLTNHGLCKMLNISLPPEEYFQDYGRSDVRVNVI
jgi:hypothetical protein